MAPEDLLVDHRLGVIRSIEQGRQPEGTPTNWLCYTATVASTQAYSPWQADTYCYGAAVGGHERARNAALGEAVERYCGNIVPASLPIGSYTNLIASGHRAVDPEALALYSVRQYETPGFPFVPFTRDLKVAWVTGQDMHAGDEVMIPASLVYLNYFHSSHASEPPTNAMCYAGIAAGTSRVHAECFALEELFERDACALWWAQGFEAPVVKDSECVLDLFDDRDIEDRDIRIRYIPSPFQIPVMTAFIEDHRRKIIGFGSACRSDPQEAAIKALIEAYGMLSLSLSLADSEDNIWRVIRQGKFGFQTFRPYRADRKYSQDFRSDLRDLLDLPGVAQFYLDPEMQGEALDRLRREKTSICFDDIPSILSTESRDFYLDQISAAGLRAFSANLTTPDVRAAELYVGRVVVPGLYGNSAAAFPYLGGRRLYVKPDGGFLNEESIGHYPIPLS